MKFLFISKPLFMEPLGIMYLSSAIKSSGHKTDLIFTSENIEEKIEEFKPDFIGYSIMTGDEKFYDEINKKIKSKFNLFSIAGGPHPTFFPEFLENSSFDAICRGEGEKAINQFLKNPSAEIPNFWVRLKNGEIIRNPVQPLEDNLDELYFPDHEIISKCQKIQETPIRHFIASRGCPFDCSYCFNKSYSELYHDKGKRVRFRSVDNLLEEIKEVTDIYPTKLVYFQDDTFTLNKKWLSEFSEKYNSKINIPFHCHVRANTIDDERVHALKNAGCYSVHLAAESGDAELRNKILNRNMSKEQIISAVKLLRESGIKYCIQNMIGLPEGNLEKDLKTLELNIECRPDYSWVSIFSPYPGTQLGKFCKEKGYYSGDFSDLSNNFFDGSKLNFPEEYKSQLVYLQKLFAIFVEHPDLYDNGLLPVMINAPQDDKIKKLYSDMYTEFRKKGDKRLYSFDVSK